MKRLIFAFLALLICGLPLVAGAWGYTAVKDHTVPGPGGRYGLYEQIKHGTDAKVSTSVCLGPVSFSLPFTEGQLLLGSCAAAVALGWGALWGRRHKVGC